MTRRWGILAALALVVGAAVGGGLFGAVPAQAAPVNAALVNAAPAHLVSADTDAFTFDSLHTDYRLTRAADHRANLAVTETFVAEFPATDQNHGILRAIPTTADGRSLHVQLGGVTDASGRPVAYEVEAQTGFTVLRIGDPTAFVHGTQTYVVKYTMRDVIHEPSPGADQQFLFDVNGTGWAQPFGTVTATLHVPAELAGALTGTNACYQGAQGSTARCHITRSGDTVEAQASNLGAHENLTMAVGFRGGTFHVPLSVPRLLVWILLGLAIVVLIAAIVVRIARLGNPKGTGIIVPQFQPYPGIGVMEAAELLDERDRAFPALITQLVVSRAATMTRDGKGTKRLSDDVYSLVLHDATELDDEDADAVHTLFGSIKPEAAVTLDRTEPTIGDRIARLLVEARQSVRKQGLIARKATAASRLLLAAGFVVAILGVVLIVVLTSNALSSWVHNLALIGVVLIGIAIVAVVYPRERRTDAAMPAYEHLLGIRDYLALAEADRIRMLQTPAGAETVPASGGESGAAPGGKPDDVVIVKLYERLLPYAILFGIEKQWREVLGRYWATTPTDVTPTLLPLQALVFANFFASGRFATTASTTSGSHSWSGSGGGGFSGGFSGGGFGGGGGGGW